MKKIIGLLVGIIVLGVGLYAGATSFKQEAKVKKEIEVTEKEPTDKTTESISPTKDQQLMKNEQDETKEEKTKEKKAEIKAAVTIDQRIAEMSLEEKVGQLFLVRVPEANQLNDIKEYHLGGYVLFSRDMEGETRASLKAKIASYQATSSIPLLIASDEEGGTVSRLSTGSNLVDTPLLSPQELYQAGEWQAIRQDITDKAAIFSDYGIHTGLAPVADISTDPASFIYDRTIGLDRKATEKYVVTAVEEMKKHKIGSTLKHFPGYGNNRDSHVDIVTDNRPLTELEENDYKPFEAGIKAGADSILVSHNIIEALDASLPASISKPVHDEIRNKLGFDGVVMTDDMDMAGLADFISQEEAGMLALKAGNDLILSSSYDRQIPYVIESVEQGELKETQIDASVKRVLTWKEKLGLL
ncbi:glycoside hydrolase family 3 protein [Vagococcus intermedius]|uniref:Beta-hexosaminidase n=1 Tax=Vagococcus intermedius TaxID=2991418 RepID=A0AAF0CVI3_9ENTE|nr:glycoside hydrolase family 3 N-terminal domain-containing protein [Vagococcus intermedius]WEG73624.1 beta-hexosaminidase [Vagococcus intermedius]WEG75708.1 beta-hexosaminidase [Vagococcus intermedius]